NVVEQRDESDRDGDARGDPPVVADDEVPPEACEPLHATAASRRRRRRSSPTRTSETSRTKARTTGRAASPSGQPAPAPAVAQKIPNVVNLDPTANFIAFSGTRASGARAATPAAATSTTAAAAPSAGNPMLPWVDPKPSTMKTTSRPSR